jgi:delta-1-pyrroline-5-carboxylate synthetase
MQFIFPPHKVGPGPRAVRNLRHLAVVSKRERARVLGAVSAAHPKWLMASSAATRSEFKNSRTIVVKVGTSCVSRPDGSLAIGRIASVVEQIAQLRLMGKHVVLVASGSIGIGTTRLKEQATLAQSVRAVLQGGGSTVGGGPSTSARARAAAGQGGLMGLYDTLFSQYSVPCGQLLLTEGDFQCPTRRGRVCDSLRWLLEMGGVPVVNENDVIARPELRNLFTDNDSLAVLIAKELKAELLVLLSDVPGVYAKKPEPGEDVAVLPIFTRSTMSQVTFGDKSSRGRGGMEAKVAAALDACESGIGAVVIASGYELESIARVVAGEAIGTVFVHETEAMKQAMLASAKNRTSPQVLAQEARLAARTLAQLGYEERREVLDAMAGALEENATEIIRANEQDVKAFATSPKHSSAMAARLVLSQKKLKGVADGIRALARQPNPLGRTKRHVEIAEGLTLLQETVPIGVLLVIFESRPDVLPQVAALSVASGNGVLLKGGKEAAKTNAVLHRTLQRAITESTRGRVGEGVLGLVGGREEIAELLKLHKDIDLVIPRGSNDLVQHVMRSTRIPTLGHADGICHMFVDKAADLAKAAPLLVDAKTDYPAACNALETLLIHDDLVGNGGAKRLIDAAKAAGVALYGGPRARATLGLPPATSMHVEYGDLAMAIELVPDVFGAIDHINAHGSGHTDVIVTEDPEAAETFLRAVDSAGVFHNCSSRFADGFRLGLGAEVGISTSRIHARGPVGVEGLLTTRNRLVSDSSHTVADFARGTASYTHRDLMPPPHSRL